MKNWTPLEIIVAYIAFVVGVILLYATFEDEEMSDEGIEIYSEVIIAFTTAILIYIGNKLKK